MAEVLAQSGYFENARTAARAFANIQAGREIGVGPMTALSNIQITKGNISISAQLQAALLKRSRKYASRVVELTDTKCSIDFYEGDERLGTTTWTIEEARRANLLKNDVWKERH
jgi:hypothetical protein